MGRGEVGGTEEGEMGEVRGGERGGGGTEGQRKVRWER